MALVVDASAAVAALIDNTARGAIIRSVFARDYLCAPSVFPYEVAATIRKHELRGDITADIAQTAHNNLELLRIAEIRYSLLARRAWELRYNVPIMDATYVALAEAIDADLITLDRRLSQSPGIRCRVRVF